MEVELHEGVNARSATPDDTKPLPAGLVLGGKYRINEMIAGGGMGIVYAATQLQTGKRVAIKVRLPNCPEHRFSS